MNVAERFLQYVAFETTSDENAEDFPSSAKELDLERFLEKEIRELIRRKEMEGLIIFIMPVAVILFLNLCAPDYISPLYETIVGRIIMTGVIAASWGIYLMIKRIVSLEI